MEKDSARKRPRENETPSQRLKREKAAERQRRKRERDRANTGQGPLPMPFPPQPPQDPHSYHPDYMPSPPPPQQQHTQQHDDTSLSPDEQARRERVRAAARERQRKHRQLVKQRKMRELGLDMGNEVMPAGLDDVHYRVAQDGSYQQVLPHELAAAHQQHQQQQQQGQQHIGEPPFPQNPNQNNAQTFATTLLISFACTPALKQNLLSILNITNDELASVEPYLAEAWDRWEQARRLRYEHPDGFPPGAVPVPISNPISASVPPGAPPNSQPGYPPPPGYPGGAGAPTADDFRGRFQRAVMTVPTPFHQAFGAPPANGVDTVDGDARDGTGTHTPSAASHHGEGQGQIDPHLGAKEGEGVKGEA
ncbi:hypothetical protein B0H19DRAFT_1248709 [Mycena capillaripes]|nr:hypothetical protein B0H19DRAFT_1248709 [Mycena capillaripes]